LDARIFGYQINASSLFFDYQLIETAAMLDDRFTFCASLRAAAVGGSDHLWWLVWGPWDTRGLSDGWHVVCRR
jgi:hypothetical protein